MLISIYGISNNEKPLVTSTWHVRLSHPLCHPHPIWAPILILAIHFESSSQLMVRGNSRGWCNALSYNTPCGRIRCNFLLPASDYPISAHFSHSLGIETRDERPLSAFLSLLLFCSKKVDNKKNNNECSSHEE